LIHFYKRTSSLTIIDRNRKNFWEGIMRSD